MEARDRSIFDGGELTVLVAELRSINESLWGIEDNIRSCGREGDFGRSSSSWRAQFTRTTTGAPPSSAGLTNGWDQESRREIVLR